MSQQNIKKNRVFTEDFVEIRESLNSYENLNLIYKRNESFPKKTPAFLRKNTQSSRKIRVFPEEAQQKSETFSNRTEPDTEIGAFVLNELDENQARGLEDARKTRFLYQKLNVSELSCLVFSLLGLGLAILSYDMDFVQSTGFTELQITLKTNDLNFVKTILQTFAMVSTGFLYVLIAIRYNIRLKWLKAKRFVAKSETLWTTGGLNFLIIEIFLVSLIPTPFYAPYFFTNFNESEQVETVYHVNDLMCLLVLLRVFVVFRIFLSNSRYYSNVAHRICSLTGCESGSSYVYVMKCLMKNSPLEILFTSMLLYILTFAYAIKVCERPLIFAILQKNLENPDFSLPVPNDISNFYNAMWLMIVTMATIGYGDFYPRTLPGRAITFFSCICGVVTVSLMTITLQNLLEMSNSESRSYNIIEKLELHRKKQKHAAFILTNLTKLGFWGGVVKKNLDEERKNYHVKQIKKHLGKFRRLRKGQNNLGGSTLHEEISRHFVFLREDYRDLERNLNKLAESNLELLDELGITQNEPSFLDKNERNSPVYSPLLKKMRYKAGSPERKVQKNNSFNQFI